MRMGSTFSISIAPECNGWIIDKVRSVNLVFHPLLRGVATSGGMVGSSYNLGRLDFLFSVPILGRIDDI